MLCSAYFRFSASRLALLVLVASFFGTLSVATAQNQTEIQKRKQEWTAAEKALHDGKFSASIPHYDRLLNGLKKLQNDPSAAPSNLSQWISRAFQGRGDAHYGLEQWKIAASDYTQSIQFDPQNAGAYALRGVARKATGDYDGLIADAQKAAQLDPQYSSLLSDANSTVLWRRAMLGFFVLGCCVLALGAIPLTKSLILLSKAGK
jgi:tetratricopeptide (TPR) repeat protein